MKIKPTLDRVLIRPTEEEESIAGIQIFRDGKNAEMQIGIIIAAGPKSTIPIGAKVMYNPAAGTLVRFLKDGKYENCRIVHSDSIQCVYSEI